MKSSNSYLFPKDSGIDGEESNISESRSYSSSSKKQWGPSCFCENLVVLRRTTIVNNFGKQFRGCPHYKGYAKNGCDYFAWYYDEVKDDKDIFIMKKKRDKKC
ncbi:uncharacterized protein LOC131638708 [Vicia villosa]|uniref:uncharacterized protein LOC131638708 n=1 Tax=Vicia villosa TaxID=3911 RepID=UPI00273BD309|nr:uncharacterized protein LOC131638708 [Vicia villosa]